MLLLYSYTIVWEMSIKHAGFEMDKILERNITILHKDLNQNCYLWLSYHDVLSV